MKSWMVNDNDIWEKNKAELNKTDVYDIKPKSNIKQQKM